MDLSSRFSLLRRDICPLEVELRGPHQVLGLKVVLATLVDILTKLLSCLSRDGNVHVPEQRDIIDLLPIDDVLDQVLSQLAASPVLRADTTQGIGPRHELVNDLITDSILCSDLRLLLRGQLPGFHPSLRDLVVARFLL